VVLAGQEQIDPKSPPLSYKFEKKSRVPQRLDRILSYSLPVEIPHSLNIDEDGAENHI
jgi:hypothetical protein